MGKTIAQSEDWDDTRWRKKHGQGHSSLTAVI